MKIEIRDVGVINDANISIKRINVVGGVNSSGKTTASKLLYCYLKSTDLLENEGFSNLNRENINFSSDSEFSDIFYLESISILDLKDLEILKFDHIKHLKECLEIPKKDYSSHVLTEIKSIISDDSYSDGIKQIRIIQMLLENQSLTDNAFLIIDEPESNLHPEWQIKFAEILVLLVKELNVVLYLNSYSPIFIEAIGLYSHYHGLIKDINFYLTKKQNDGRFNFKKINPRNLGDVYENLTGVYDELDNIKAKILFKE